MGLLLGAAVILGLLLIGAFVGAVIELKAERKRLWESLMEIDERLMGQEKSTNVLGPAMLAICRKLSGDKDAVVRLEMTPHPTNGDELPEWLKPTAKKG